MNKLTKWVKFHKPRTAGLSIALVALVALAVAGATGVFSTKHADTASNKPTVTVEVPANTKKTPLKIDVAADDKVTEASTTTMISAFRSHHQARRA